MFKLLISAIIVAAPPISCFSKTVDVIYNAHDNITQIQTSEKTGINTVEFHEGARLLGRYHNLIEDELAVTSTIVQLAGGGVALAIDSNGSRNKYHIVVPIVKDDKELFFDCIYRTSYDAVDGGRSVGSSCRKRPLAEFDVGSAISEDGMIAYTDALNWLGAVSKTTCRDAVGFEYAGYHVVRCSENGLSDSIKQTIFAFDKNDNLIFTVSGYELIPSRNNFSLISDLQDKTIVFDGIWRCYQYSSASGDANSGNAKIANRFSIRYVVRSVNDCLIGHYSYVAKSGQMTLQGYKKGHTTYLLELNSHRQSTGLFMLDSLAEGAQGVWIAAPPKDVLMVN